MDIPILGLVGTNSRLVVMPDRFLLRVTTQANEAQANEARMEGGASARCVTCGSMQPLERRYRAARHSLVGLQGDGKRRPYALPAALLRVD